jgi:hypothetical protein
MTTGMQCRRAEELFSDSIDGTLGEVLRADLEGHLATCVACRELRDAVSEVVEALRRPAELEAPAGLAGRAAAAAFFASAPAVRRAAAPSALGVPPWLQAVAAGLAVITTALVLLAAVAIEDPKRTATRLVERTVNAGAYLSERKEQLLEDFRILRVVIGTAFEGRLDRMNDRVDDYRRLLERRRLAGEEEKKNRGTGDVGASLRTADPLKSEPAGGSTRNRV